MTITTSGCCYPFFRAAGSRRADGQRWRGRGGHRLRVAARLNLDGPDDAGPRWFRSNQFESLSAGTYDFTADAVGYLPAYCVGKAVAAPQTTLAAGELVAGDVNDERVIVILDAVAVGAAFGTQASILPLT
jgi:hypothetical protein